MKKYLFPIAAAAALVSFNQSQAGTVAPPPPLSVFKGNGIFTHPMDVPRVSMEIFPANPARGQVSAGAIFIALEGRRIPSSSFPFKLSLNFNLYSISEDGQESLVTEIVDMQPYMQARTPGGPSYYHLLINDKNVFPEPLAVGRYRAESVLVMWTPGGFDESTGMSTEPVPIEAGGAALNFSVRGLNVTSISDIDGEIKTSAGLIINNPRNAVAARAAAATIVKNQREAVRAWIANANTVPSGAPNKIPVHSTESTIPGRDVSGFAFKVVGQLYTDHAAAQMAKLQQIVAAGNRSYAVPGGTLHLKTTPVPPISPADPTAVNVGTFGSK